MNTFFKSIKMKVTSIALSIALLAGAAAACEKMEPVSASGADNHACSHISCTHETDCNHMNCDEEKANVRSLVRFADMTNKYRSANRVWTCNSCGGTGQCWSCGGTGLYGNGTCSMCSGTGRCYYCKGTGRI